MKIIRRLLCFAALFVCLSLSALAVPKPDGRFGPLEYNETLSVLQIRKNESNNNLLFAYLHWAASPADHSVYLAIQYQCSDRTLEDGLTGVMVYVNDVLVGTIYADGTIEGVDHYRYELVGVLDDGKDRTPFESFCEVRAGVKFWPEGDVYAGIQILDFSGNPSNYYRQLVYSAQPETTKPDETTAARKTETEKTTAAKTTTQTTAAETTARTTKPVITAASAHGSTAAATSAEAPTVLPPASVPANAAAPKTTKPQTTKSKTTKAKTTKAKTTKASAAKRDGTTGTSAAATTTAAPAADVLPATTETTVPVETAAHADAQMYSELNKVRIVGTVLVAVILTAAIMSAVFLGMRQKEKPETHTPQEEYDDFG